MVDKYFEDVFGDIRHKCNITHHFTLYDINVICFDKLLYMVDIFTIAYSEIGVNFSRLFKIFYADFCTWVDFPLNKGSVEFPANTAYNIPMGSLVYRRSVWQHNNVSIKSFMELLQVLITRRITVVQISDENIHVVFYCANAIVNGLMSAAF